MIRSARREEGRFPVSGNIACLTAMPALAKRKLGHVFELLGELAAAEGH